MPAPFFNDHQVNAPRFADAIKRVFGLKGAVHPEILDKIQVGIQLNDLSGPEYLRTMRGNWCRAGGFVAAVAAQNSGLTVRFPLLTPARYIAIVRQLWLSGAANIGWGVIKNSVIAPFGTNASSLPLDSRDEVASLGGSLQLNYGTSAAPGYAFTLGLAAGNVMIPNAAIFRPGDQFALITGVNNPVQFDLVIEIRECENSEVL